MTPISIAVPASKGKYYGRSARELSLIGRSRQSSHDPLQGQGGPQRASAVRLKAQWSARNGERFRIGTGLGLYLSGDGQGVTPRSAEAWFGTFEQAELALQRFASAQGMHALRVIDKLLPDRANLSSLG
jgi:hypothetical protein